MKKCLLADNAVIIMIAFLLFSSCTKPFQNRLATEIDSIAKIWVPDSREGICSPVLDTVENQLVLKGETNYPAAKSAITNFLKSRNIEFADSMMILPDTMLIERPWGLVTVSVCNLRLNPSQDAEMVSQSIMGTPVKILKVKHGWYLVQTPDSYLGWTEGESVETLNYQEYLKWKSSRRIIFLNKTGDIYLNPENKTVVSDIVAGCILNDEGKEKGYYRVTLPDGRKGYLKEEDCREFSGWAALTKPEGDNLVETAFRFMGTPYLWGGTSSKGMDCSGFTKTVYYLNGIILSRDVSLQYRHVLHMTPKAFPDSLQKGDLLFFGSVLNGKPRPTHVGMYIGNKEFIHCSGMVRVNSLDSTRSNFSRYRRNSFLGAGRIIGLDPEPGIQPVSDHHWYK
jgi:gamma-D-glutamyl-L-lysine dipeptidyl-peptidase